MRYMLIQYSNETKVYMVANFISGFSSITYTIVITLLLYMPHSSHKPPTLQQMYHHRHTNFTHKTFLSPFQPNTITLSSCWSRLHIMHTKLIHLSANLMLPKCPIIQQTTELFPLSANPHTMIRSGVIRLYSECKLPFNAQVLLTTLSVNAFLQTSLLTSHCCNYSWCPQVNNLFVSLQYL